MTEEPKLDPEIREALARLDADVPYDAVNWDLLHRRILARTSRAVETMRRTWTWLDYTARWARAAIPLATAAIIALAAWLPGHTSSPAGAIGNASEEPVSGREALTLALTGDVSEHDLVHAVVDPAASEWLLPPETDSQ